MRRNIRSQILTKLISASLVFCVSAGILTGDKAGAQSLLGGLTQTTQNGLQMLDISSDLLQSVLQARIGDRTNVIVQSKGPWSFTLDTLIVSLGGRVTSTYNNLDMRGVDMPLRGILQLAASLQVSYISLDRPVGLLGHLSATTGADAANLPDNSSSGLDGTGIGIAVLDSGIYSAHRSFLGKNNNVRIVANKDFTGERRTDDPYGHGSHVASIAAGSGRVSNGAFVGIAPNADLINLRVLNSQGSGSTSGLLSALDWIMSNRATYNIRVVNMSLGAAAVDSYKYDPTCKAVRRLVDSGIVVVAAAGNNGENSSGQKVYGQIHSPGIEPSALTVGASNSFGTDTRSDDTLTSYSSRGPTRGYWTDSNNARHYDNLIKPDIVAPGNKIIAAEAVNNLLVTQHPELDAGVSSVDNRKMMRLSGTSMATPVAAGAAALLLQANPKLTPNMVKAILMYTSQPLAGYNMFEQGSGELNLEGAVRLARLVRTDITKSTSLGAPLLITQNTPEPRSTIARYNFSWAQGLMLNYTYATGFNLIALYQRIYDTGVLLSDGVLIGNGVIAGDTNMLTSGIGLGDNIMTSSGVIAGDGTPFCASGVLIGDGGLSEGGVIGDGVIAGDSTGVIAGDTQICGDNTTSMGAVVDSGN